MTAPPTTSVRDVLVLAVGLLPAGGAKNALLRRLGGWQVGEGAVLRPSVFWRIRAARVGAHVAMGIGNMLANIRELDLGDHVQVGKLNWITTTWQLDGLVPTTGVLRLGEHAAIVGPHAVDCSGGVEVGAFSTLAGRRTTVLTHQVDYVRNRQTPAPVVVGERSLVSGCVNLAPGSRVPDRSLVAMGSTVLPGLTEPGRLYAGVPARSKKEVDGAYFRRTVGYVD